MFGLFGVYNLFVAAEHARLLDVVLHPCHPRVLPFLVEDGRGWGCERRGLRVPGSLRYPSKIVSLGANRALRMTHYG